MRNLSGCLFAVFAFMFIAVAPAAAMPSGVALLDVEVQDETMAVIGSAVTDDLGYFSVAGLAAGDYVLVISDPLSDLGHTQNFTVPPDIEPALLHGRVTSDAEADISFDVTASLVDEAALPEEETYTVRLRFKWNSNSVNSNGKLWVFVQGSDVSVIENVILSTEEGSLEPAATKINDEQTKLMAEFSKREAYQALVPPASVRGDTIDVTVSIVTPAGTQEEVITVRILGRK